MPHTGASSNAYAGYYASAATLSASGDSSATQDAPTAVWGYIAVTLSLIYKVPQIIHLYRTGDVAAISITSQIVQASAYIFYMIHGSIVDDRPVVLLGVASLIQSLVLIFQYYRYRGKVTRSKSLDANSSSSSTAPKSKGSKGKKHKRSQRRKKRLEREALQLQQQRDGVFSSSTDDEEGGKTSEAKSAEGASVEMVTVVATKA
eukprot:INCI5534.1.p1 GENE.INCI5534.1~~INCI5534.1.p1  ORF type:complete len:204 (-),score=46.62 INCI5534.1:300-911(-)